MRREYRSSVLGPSGHHLSNTKRFGFICLDLHPFPVQPPSLTDRPECHRKGTGEVAASEIDPVATNPKLSGFPIIDNPEFETHRGPSLVGLANLR